VTLFDADPILAIVRFRTPAALDEVFDAIRRGGIGLVEVTADTPGALAAVRARRSPGRRSARGRSARSRTRARSPRRAPHSW
jgi:2-keto-3-deoxy-6-phosphogluconate aldolase